LRKLGNSQAVCLNPSFDDETNDFSVFSWRTLIPIAESRSQRTKLFASVRLNRETELLKVPWILSLKSKMHTLRTSHVHENIKTNNPTWNHIEMNIFIFFVFIFVQWNLQHLSIILYDCVYCLKITCGHPGFHLRISSREANLLLFKGALQSDLRMCKKEPTFYDTNSLTMFWVLAKPDCCFLIIYYTLIEAWKYKLLTNKAQYFGHKNVNKGFVYIRTVGHL
jgi:hypothetical protein